MYTYMCIYMYMQYLNAVPTVYILYMQYLNAAVEFGEAEQGSSDSGVPHIVHVCSRQPLLLPLLPLPLPCWPPCLREEEAASWVCPGSSSITLCTHKHTHTHTRIQYMYTHTVTLQKAVDD